MKWVLFSPVTLLKNLYPLMTAGASGCTLSDFVEIEGEDTMVPIAEAIVPITVFSLSLALGASSSISAGAVPSNKDC